jgi:hypothetical protein
MATRTPVLKREKDLHARTEIRELQRRVERLAIPADPSPHAQLWRPSPDHAHLKLLALIRKRSSDEKSPELNAIFKIFFRSQMPRLSNTVRSSFKSVSRNNMRTHVPRTSMKADFGHIQ